MKKLIALSFVFVSVIITGCKPNTPPVVDTHPANLVGKWKAEFAPAKANVTIGITTETNGAAVFGQQVTYTIARGDTLDMILALRLAQ